MSYQNRNNENILTKMQHVTIEMNHPNGYFRVDISIIDSHHGEKPSWDIIRECARILMRYTMEEDEQTVAVVNYNGVYAGECIYWTMPVKKVLWYGRDFNYKGRDIWL